MYRVEDARQAAEGGANEVVFDPFLRHPMPPVTRVRALADELAARGVSLRLRTPTIVRPEDRPSLDKWLALDLPLLSGHVGLACELASSGRDVVADYAVNCFNQHTAAELFARGIRRHHRVGRADRRRAAAARRARGRGRVSRCSSTVGPRA